MIKLEPLIGHHDRNPFDCGVEQLNLWLQQTALQHQNKGLSRTFVAQPSHEGAAAEFRNAGYAEIGVASILGYYALASALVVIEDLPSDPVPAWVRLATRLRNAPASLNFRPPLRNS